MASLVAGRDFPAVVNTAAVAVGSEKGFASRPHDQIRRRNSSKTRHTLMYKTNPTQYSILPLRTRRSESEGRSDGMFRTIKPSRPRNRRQSKRCKPYDSKNVNGDRKCPQNYLCGDQPESTRGFLSQPPGTFFHLRLP